MSETFYKVVDEGSYQIFYSLPENRLILPSEFTADPKTQYAQLIEGPLPDIRLHWLYYQGVLVSLYGFNLFRKELVLKDPYYQWFYGMDTPAFLSSVQPATVPSVNNVVRFSLYKTDSTAKGAKLYNKLVSKLESTPDEVALREDTEVLTLVRTLSDWILDQALEALE